MTYPHNFLCGNLGSFQKIILSLYFFQTYCLLVESPPCGWLAKVLAVTPVDGLS